MPSLRSALRRLLWLAFAGLAGLLVVTALGRLHWLAELSTHFAVYWALAGLLLAFAALVIGARSLAAGALALAALHAFHVWPYVPGLAAADARASAPIEGLRVLAVNVYSGNPHHDVVESLIREEAPDVVALLEITDAWLEGLRGLEADYPHRIARPQLDNFGIALFSRRPIDDLEVTPLLNPGLPMVRGRLDVGGTPVHLFVVHPVPPANAYYSMLRDLQIEHVASLVRELPTGEVIVMGDLNATPWSPIHRDLEASTGLRNAARGRGVVNTWPSQLAPVMIPLDHVLLSEGLRVSAIRRFPVKGSDHDGVWVELR